MASGGLFPSVFDVFTEDVEGARGGGGQELEGTGSGLEWEGEEFRDDLWLEGVSEAGWVNFEEVDPGREEGVSTTMVASCSSDSSSNRENLLDNEISDLVCLGGLLYLRFFVFSVLEVSETDDVCFCMSFLTAIGFTVTFLCGVCFLADSAYDFLGKRVSLT